MQAWKHKLNHWMLEKPERERERRGEEKEKEEKSRERKKTKKCLVWVSVNVLRRYYKLVHSFPFLLKITIMEHVDTAG